ncbi:hypothetical protein [Salinarchaeum sp. IM2453]|nr:hypothetical protein [Salinarchaeum sp. IM2453]
MNWSRLVMWILLVIVGLFALTATSGHTAIESHRSVEIVIGTVII